MSSCINSKLHHKNMFHYQMAFPNIIMSDVP